MGPTLVFVSHLEFMQESPAPSPSITDNTKTNSEEKEGKSTNGDANIAPKRNWASLMSELAQIRRCRGGDIHRDCRERRSLN